MTPTASSRRRHLCGIVAAALVVLPGLSAGATPGTGGDFGTITSVTDPSGVLDPAVVVGAPFSGAYTLDPAVATIIAPVSGGSLHLLVSPGLTTASIGSALYTSP